MTQLGSAIPPLFVSVWLAACGGAGGGHRVVLTPPNAAGSADPLVALIGNEKSAGIAPFYGLYKRDGTRLGSLDEVPNGLYSLAVRPPCGPSAEKTIELRGDRTLQLEMPKHPTTELYTSREIHAAELRYADNLKSLVIPADATVQMLRPWPLKLAGEASSDKAARIEMFVSGKDCTGALVRVLDPKSPSGEFYIVPRSALAHSIAPKRIESDDDGDEESEEPSASDDADASE